MARMYGLIGPRLHNIYIHTVNYICVISNNDV